MIRATHMDVEHGFNERVINVLQGAIVALTAIFSLALFAAI